MEAGRPVMKSSNCTRGKRSRAIARGLAYMSGALLLFTCLSFQSKSPGIPVQTDQNPPADSGYVGSRACAKCHASIYASFSRTDMGHSMSEITPAVLERIPTSGSIFDPSLNRHFEISAHDNNLYQSEYETNASGNDVFRETRKLEWIIGS